MKEAHIQGYMTTAEAAKASGLSAHRIGCLARAGEIEAAKSGNTILVDAASLQSYITSNQGRGRPMDEKSAYGALWTLSGNEASWLTYAQARRLTLRLRSTTAESLSWQLRKRAQVRRYRASESFAKSIADSIILSGLSSTHVDEFGLLATTDIVEGYCFDSDCERLVSSFFLVEDPLGNVVIHAASWLPDYAAKEMPLAVVAADLAQSLDTRERTSGLKILERMLDAYRKI